MYRGLTLALLLGVVTVMGLGCGDDEGPDVDATAPAAVTDLAAGAPTHNSVNLTWTAPGDDGAIGTRRSMKIRYSLAQITAGNWDGRGLRRRPDTSRGRHVRGLHGSRPCRRAGLSLRDQGPGRGGQPVWSVQRGKCDDSRHHRLCVCRQVGQPRTGDNQFGAAHRHRD